MPSFTQSAQANSRGNLFHLRLSQVIRSPSVMLHVPHGSFKEDTKAHPLPTTCRTWFQLWGLQSLDTFPLSLWAYGLFVTQQSHSVSKGYFQWHALKRSTVQRSAVPKNPNRTKCSGPWSPFLPLSSFIQLQSSYSCSFWTTGCLLLSLNIYYVCADMLAPENFHGFFPQGTQIALSCKRLPSWLYTKKSPP